MDTNNSPLNQDTGSAPAAGNISGQAAVKIFLIGIMGSGKTYWAQRLADQFTMNWIDLDQQIEKVTDMPVRDIFATQGEEYFRLKERDTLRQFDAVDNIIIADRWRHALFSQQYGMDE